MPNMASLLCMSAPADIELIKQRLKRAVEIDRKKE